MAIDHEAHKIRVKAVSDKMNHPMEYNDAGAPKTDNLKYEKDPYGGKEPINKYGLSKSEYQKDVKFRKEHHQRRIGESEAAHLERVGKR